ncbi:SRPBCC family protein [Altererythrobacter sp. SALINAS58]|uniref:SRPBCC family protein n=1 Tax=Alteripontixanthobacter muriae TaxID=2705546 RepID=UPI001576AEF0|nr:SRPBCC family protein [Alteripontixanthobacter muriae]NTZ43207.1 SRPBCC family protein [Alteripontixanthobacter muriae]
MNAAQDPEDLDLAARAAVTIGRPADALRLLWLAPDTLPRIMSHFADVEPIDERVAQWSMEAPLGRTLRWRTQIEEKASDHLAWTSLDGADVPNAGALQFAPAPGDRGTEVTLDVRFDPPGGLIGEGVAKLFHVVPREMVLKALYNFRALALTGEIPTTEPQPAARNGGMDK